MSARTYRTSLIVLAIALFLHSAAYANSGVPMLGVVWPLAWSALIPIIAIEAVVGKNVTTAPWKSSIWASMLANGVSTLFGIPLTWILLVLIEMQIPGSGRAYGLHSPSGIFLSVIVQAPMLVPYDDQLDWLIPAATTVLLPIFAAASILIEKPIFAAITGCEKAIAKRWAWRANLLTYGMAMSATLTWLLIAIVRHVPAT